jgi:hypothetical protein
MTFEKSDFMMALHHTVIIFHYNGSHSIVLSFRLGTARCRLLATDQLPEHDDGLDDALLILGVVKGFIRG